AASGTRSPASGEEASWSSPGYGRAPSPGSVAAGRSCSGNPAHSEHQHFLQDRSWHHHRSLDATTDSSSTTCKGFVVPCRIRAAAVPSPRGPLNSRAAVDGGEG